jgi:sugar-phosphatase
LPGAAALLGCGRTLAVVTSCSLALASVRLEAAGLRMPEVIVSCDDVAVGKPDPACFLLGASRLGVAPERCLVLEDSPAGVRAGVAAGAHVIAVRTTHGDEELTEAHAIVDDLSALVASPTT